jgi:hypothetical protein
MLLSFVVFFMSFYLAFFRSFHSLIVLLFVETLVLLVLMVLFILYVSWFTSLMFLLVAVCLGAYGVSLFVSVSRSKGVDYYLSF